MINCVVRTARSGGSLDIADLTDFARRNDFKFIPCDIEFVDKNILKNNKIFGIEILCNKQYSYVVYSIHNEKSKIIEFINKYNNWNFERLKEIYFYLIKNHIKNTTFEPFNKNFTLSYILELMVQKGFAISTKDAINQLSPVVYINDNKKVEDMLNLFGLRFLIKSNGNLDVEKIKNTKNCLGIILNDEDKDLAHKIKECEDNSIDCLLCTEFSSHHLNESYKIINNSKYVLESQKRLNLGE